MGTLHLPFLLPPRSCTDPLSLTLALFSTQRSSSLTPDPPVSPHTRPTFPNPSPVLPGTSRHERTPPLARQTRAKPPRSFSLRPTDGLGDVNHVDPDRSNRPRRDKAFKRRSRRGASFRRMLSITSGALPASIRNLAGIAGTPPSGGATIANTNVYSPGDGPHDPVKCGCQRIRVNVSGQHYDMRIGLLNRHPTTVLGNPAKRAKYYDRMRNEYFFDRHRPSFEAIFLYYQYGGRLRRPMNVPDDIFLSELYFYEIEDEVVDEYKRTEGYVSEQLEFPSNHTLKQIWMLFEYPETSRTAMVIAVLSVFFTLVSIILFCVETLPMFALTHCVAGEAPNFADPFFVIETTCTLWFTVEVIVRYIACPNKLTFWKDFKNIVDVTAVIPYYVTFINVVSTMSCESAKSSASLAFLRVIRLIRVFKLTKHSTGLQVLILTFKASVEGLGLFLIALVVCLLVFSSAIYFAELGNEKSMIHSIPDAFWYIIITMTTVGYGDKVPVGIMGKVIGSMCAITGVLTLAIPVPIITGNFNRFYAHKTGRGRHT